MGTKTEAEVLRAEISALSKAKKARRYPDAMKQRVVRWAGKQVASGTSVAALCGGSTWGRRRFNGSSTRPDRQRRDGRRWRGSPGPGPLRG